MFLPQIQKLKKLKSQKKKSKEVKPTTCRAWLAENLSRDSMCGSITLVSSPNSARLEATPARAMVGTWVPTPGCVNTFTSSPTHASEASSGLGEVAKAQFWTTVQVAVSAFGVLSPSSTMRSRWGYTAVVARRRGRSGFLCFGCVVWWVVGE